MNISISIKSALRTLRRNKTRSILTSIGIVIGVSSVIMMVGFGSSAKIIVREKVFSFGENAMVVFSEDNRFPLRQKDSNVLKSYYSEIIYSSLLTNDENMKVAYLDKIHSTNLFAIENDYIDIQKWEFKYGDSFAEEDVDGGKNVAILGESVRKTLFGYNNPVGKVITVNDIPFRVVGSLKSKGISFTQDDFDDFVFIPYFAYHKRIKTDYFNSVLYVSAKDENSVNKVVSILNDYFRKKHKLNQEQSRNFSIKTDEENLEIANLISTTLSSLLIGIASISLIVGGIGIMNIMLVSVNERTREIGIRMAIGAKKKDILLQFIIESVTLCSIGGITGIILGYGVYISIIVILGWKFYFSFISIIVSFSFACFVGVFFGYYPAKKAASLHPIEALRYE